MHAYKKETGKNILLEGCWLKKDRKKQTNVWKQSNIYNLALKNGNLKYKSICEIRDFYKWFDSERKKQGHEMRGVGVATIAIGQLSKLDKNLICILIIRNKEVIDFANQGAKKVLEFAFPLLKEIYFSKLLINGEEAINWDLTNGKEEQCKILDPLYVELSDEALCKLERMAKGKGIFCFGVPKGLKYEGSLNDCESRFNHAVNKLLPYYMNH
ncbi:MAG: hypothetical protein JEZ09_19200 [Salinivirgaceae bacterium]|nr:hypothetical protein [Salinivirgaceae bacterium]